jgi:hypothetical protein
MAAHGTRGPARLQLGVGTWPCSSGLVPTAASGIAARASSQLEVGTWLCSSGRVRMAAGGLRAPARLQPRVGTWLCCSGLVPMAARGMGTRACVRVGTGLCSSGLLRMAAPNGTIPVSMRVRTQTQTQTNQAPARSRTWSDDRETTTDQAQGDCEGAGQRPGRGGRPAGVTDRARGGTEQNGMVWYGAPPTRTPCQLCSVTEGGGVMQRPSGQ